MLFPDFDQLLAKSAPFFRLYMLKVFHDDAVFTRENKGFDAKSRGLVTVRDFKVLG
jgi:hypothetical protein